MDKSQNKIFDDDPVLIEELKGHVKLINYRDLLIRPLGPELTKIFEKNRNKYASKNFLKGIEYEYGSNNNKIDLKKAFSIYKEFSDKNDFFCLYKMHIIYLLEYEKFCVKLDRNLEKFYLLKCLAYAPNYLCEYDKKIFNRIDLLEEIIGILDIEDPNCEKHSEFLDYLDNNKDEFKLSENEYIFIKQVFKLSIIDDEEYQIENLKELKKLIIQNQENNLYYQVMSKGIYFQYKNLSSEIFLKSEIREFYNKILDNKIYEYYYDYGMDLLRNNNGLYNEDILDIFKQSLNYEFYFSRESYYHALLNTIHNNYNFNIFLTDYNKASNLLNCLLDLIACDYDGVSEFIFLYGLLKEKSKFPQKICHDYLKYVKEIYNFIYFLSHEKMKEFREKTFDDKVPCERIIGLIYFLDIFKRDINKANEFFKKNMEKDNYKNEIFLDAYFLFRGKEILKQKKKITEEEFLNKGKDFCNFFLENGLNVDNSFEYYVFGKLYYDGIGYEKDKSLALHIFNKVKNINIFYNFLEIYCRDEAIKILINENIDNIDKVEIKSKFNEQICCVCYDKKPDSIICPCKHVFCYSCVYYFQNEHKCPICRGKILCIANIK